MRPFSRRYARPLDDKTIVVPSLSTRLRKRLLYAIHDFNTPHYSLHGVWQDTTTPIEEATASLLKAHGEDELRGYQQGKSVVTDFSGLITTGWPPRVLDAIEIFYNEVEPQQRLPFQAQVNSILDEENYHWRLVDGQFYLMDSSFMNTHVLERVEELMKASKYMGALEEFREARNDLSSGDTKSAIHAACKSFESTLKTILTRDSGNADVLLREIRDKGFFDDLPEAVRGPFVEQLLKSLPMLRNRCGGHGQGSESVSVPAHYAELAVYLAGAFNILLMKRHSEISPPAEPVIQEDEIPF